LATNYAPWIEEGRPCRLLIIEDNLDDITLLREALGQSGMSTEIETLTGGKEALEFVATCGFEKDSFLPDAILLDMNLPGVSGETLLKAIRSNEHLAGKPLAILTSSLSLKARSKMIELGVEHFIAKPADLDEFLHIGSLVREILGGVAECRGE